MRKIQLFIKRAFDITVSLIMIILLTVIPVMIVIPIAIKLTSKGPAVFKQERVGRGGKVFNIYKFRTMRLPEDCLDENGNPRPPKERITKVGKFLRKTSLDELMQLFNVLNGTMSIVGPRPTLPKQVEKYTDYHKRRHEMRPGVTGWAQVNGRNNIKWEKKIELDIEYIDNFSLWMDIKIMFKTVGVIFKSEGIAFKDGDSALTPKSESMSGTEQLAVVSEGNFANADGEAEENPTAKT